MKESESYVISKIQKVLRECEYEGTDAINLLQKVIIDISKGD